MSSQVVCDFCHNRIVDHDLDFNVRYEQVGRPMLVGIGSQMDVCGGCKLYVEVALGAASTALCGNGRGSAPFGRTDPASIRRTLVAVLRAGDDG